jgi:hypothetical protein
MKRRSLPKTKKERSGGLSKYAQKQLSSAMPQQSNVPASEKRIVAPSTSSPQPPSEQTRIDSEWEAYCTISDIWSNGTLFLMTIDKVPERVFVPATLLECFMAPAISDKVRCRVSRNEHGLIATKVLRIEKSTSV